MPTSGSTSGTYSFAPSVGELVVAAYRRIGIHRSELLTEHFADATTETNLMQSQWANLGPLLWTVDLQTVNLVQGQALYSVPENTIMMLDVYISVPNGDGTTSDRIITPISRTEYASMPNKSQQASPTCFWFDRIISQGFTLWQVPDGTEPTLSYYRFTQPQDAVIANAGAPQAPFTALDAFVAGLSHRLARIYAPDKEAAREADAQKALNTMFNQLVENTPLYIQPTTAGYWN